MTDRATDDDSDLDLPALGESSAEELDGVEQDVPIELSLIEDGGDPFDDSYADDVPLDVEIHTDHVEESAIGEITLGIDDHTGDDGVRIEEGGESMIDEGRGHAEEGLDFVGDDNLGIDPIPTEVDDGGLEGLEDPDGERVDESEFPPLDGADDDETAEELDIGIDFEPPPPSEELGDLDEGSV